MKRKGIAVFVCSIFLIAQTRPYAAAATTPPVYQVTVVQAAAKAINYRDLKGSVEIDFKGTVLLPSAMGLAEVRNKAGVTKIKAEFEKLTTPTQFGAEYLTYVFWAISPDGRATNLGELIVKNEKSALTVETPLQSLSLLVTAEPYFAVSQPSNVVILENAIKPDNKDKIELIDAKFELLPRGEYTKNISATDLQPFVMDKKTPFYVYQARNAVRIAKAAGAEAYAAEGYRNAERLLALSETKAGGKKGRSMTAREAVQAAEDSRSISVKRRDADTVAMERKQSKDEVTTANSQAATAVAGQVVAENAQAKAELKTKQAEDEKTALRAQLLQQLNAVLQTQDTARGLIVNMSGALFQTGSSTLRPEVREKLAKIAGIVSSHPGLNLDVEGYTDNVGSDAANQRLSENRAQAAMNYLVSQGVPAKSIESRGFGETNPVESNDTADGRQKNRRVDVVVSGAAIGTLAQAK